MRVKVLISLKSGVLDPQAKAIYHALSAHGFESLKSVKMSKEIILDLDETSEQVAHKKVQEMCEALLANVVIEDYYIEICR
ncbi:phosphoribosylformylglycinamidine synthase subunit PurS [Helicobacter jaachi]|uniref:Phosphoribosylformylglycinamidine synthase subunit PurS n=1 Tax=Helicobacter jaachi TaxID=1677920 RepID=A0A4U8T6H5_9HELI|nr:phosphoribosylformylglycinamidine synthase subunit PurS [Helicobacter jaachi]TLD95145.1 phosphoribosylformylglycinamidine synthase subunit PurS [Helicobacter jaachi]